MKSYSESYAAAGVDITAGYRAVELMKQHIARTITAGAASDIGGFGGLFELDITGMEYREFFEYCIKRLAEIGFVDDSGHVWNDQDVINEYYKLEMLIKNSG